MTYPEFLEALRETPRHWQLQDIAAKGSSLRLAGSNKLRTHCPIRAVAVSWHPEANLGAALHSAAKIGLDVALARKIADAADGYKSCDRDIRRDLLEACGLA